MYKYFWLNVFLSAFCLFSVAVAAQSSATPLSCYLPTQNNVSYSSVISLAKSSPNVVLEYGPNELQFGELWLPPSRYQGESSYKFPLVVFIHGGCWLKEYDISHTHALSTALAESGYAVWSIEYRRIGDAGGGWPGSFNDVVAAIDYVGQLQDYPVDLNNVILSGHSAGGHLALLASTFVKQPLSATIGLAAIVDIEEYAKGNNSCEVAATTFIGESLSDESERVIKLNPAAKPFADNTVLIHGEADSIVAIEQADKYPKQLKRVQEAGHFDMIHPATAAYQEFLKQLALASK